MKSDCSTSNLSLELRCETSNFCRCNVFLKVVRSFVSDVSSYFTESRGGPEGSGGKSILVDYICKCVDVIIVRLNTKA